MMAASDLGTSLESTLTCPICYERLQIPVQLPCSHSFCSVCIRNWLKSDKRCPVCSEHAKPSNLVPNRIAEQILELLKLHESDVKQPAQATAQATALNLKPDENRTSCPICSQIVALDDINSHLDKCPGKHEGKRSRQRLPVVSLNIVSDKALRNQLISFGLSTKGSRTELENRWSCFAILFEANQDRPNPAPLSEVFRRVESEERARNRRHNEAPSPFRRNVNTLGTGDSSFHSLVSQLQQQKKKRKLAESVDAESRNDEDKSHPNELKNAESHASDASSGGIKNEDDKLPWPWRKIYLPAYGRPMYYNRDTREGTFRCPIHSANCSDLLRP